MTATSNYNEFQWESAVAANGASGTGLANAFIDVVRSLPQVNRVCDLGCGNGYMAGRLALLGYEVTGIDASESGIAIAQRNHAQPKFIQALINSKLAQETGQGDFDLVVSSDVIEHLYRPADLIEAAFSLLKPNGRIIVGTPYHGYLKNVVLSLTGRMDSHFTALHNGGHIKFFSVKTLSELMTSHGFADLTFTFYGRAPWLWMNMICLAQKASND